MKLSTYEKAVIEFISQEIRTVLKKVDPHRVESFEEIRLRANKPLMASNYHGDWFIQCDGSLSKVIANSFYVKQEDIINTLELMSQNSIYAYQDEIKNGFITLKGGHRVGITGRIVMENNKVKNIKDISGMNIRLAREVPGCSRMIFGYLKSGGTDVCNTMIISPPQCGKTTMLRDIARTLSDGWEDKGFKGMTVGIVDERSEIAACNKGVPQFNVGMRTDVLDGCPKNIGMTMMIRSMSPRVIITDEIGNQGDMEAVMSVLNAGVKIITSAHGYDITELRSRKEVISMIDARIFDRYVVLSGINGPGTVEEIVDGKNMEVIYRRG